MHKPQTAYLRPQPEDPTVVRRFVPSSTKLQWVNGDTLRDPQPAKTTYPLREGFTAAGKHYLDLASLSAEASGTPRDIYGREVLHFKERFPCFDSYDYLHEHRYYHWFYIFDSSRLTEVYYADERQEIQVTEDVAEISNKWWSAIEEAWGKNSR